MPGLSKPGSQALRKGRYSRRKGVYLVTIVTDGRRPWFGKFEVACAMGRLIERSGSRLDIRVLCWVVMPDHVHLLIQLGETELSQVIARFKASSALRLNRALGRSGRFWTPGFHDHGVRENENVRRAARYIVANPLRAGIVTRVGDYPFWNAVWL